MFFLKKKIATKVASNQSTKQEQTAKRAKLRELQLELLERVSGGGCSPGCDDESPGGASRFVTSFRPVSIT